MDSALEAQCMIKRERERRLVRLVGGEGRGRGEKRAERYDERFRVRIPREMKRTCETRTPATPGFFSCTRCLFSFFFFCFFLSFPSHGRHIFRKSEWRRRSRLSRLLPLANAYTIHIARSSNDAPTRRTSVVLNATARTEMLRAPFPNDAGIEFYRVES